MKYGEKVILLDGDDMRKIFPNTGFDRKSRDEHVERIGRLALLLAEDDSTIICALVSPFESSRNKIKEIATVPFYLIYVKCNIEECIKRDVKGLYKKAINGEIKDFTGISQEYEEPESADVVVDTKTETVNKCVEKIIKCILKNKNKKLKII